MIQAKGLSHFMWRRSSEEYFIQREAGLEVQQLQHRKSFTWCVLIFSQVLCHSNGSIKPLLIATHGYLNGKFWNGSLWKCFPDVFIWGEPQNSRRLTQLNKQRVTTSSQLHLCRFKSTWTYPTLSLSLTETKKSKIVCPSPLCQPCHNPRLLNSLVHFRPW